MEGTVGFTNGEWHYSVRLGRIDGMDEVVCVTGFKSEKAARAALERVQLGDLDEQARGECRNGDEAGRSANAA